MADVNISKYRASVVRSGSAPATPGFVVSEGQNPVEPAGSEQNHLPVTINATATGLAITTDQVLSGAGTVGQYIRGDGSLADFPASTGGGSSVSYYLNGSISQGTIGGVAYKELSKVPILGTGTDFTINANGYIAQFLTDAGDPNLLEIPGGNWNFETYFSASSGGGSPTFYVELYKYDGSTFTLIASNSGNPELIAFGTNVTSYFSTLAVPTTALTLTDRLAIRYYVTHSGRTITLHTENNHLCQVITTFTTGLTALNGLTAQVQYFAVGTSGTDFNISSATQTHTFNLPTASATNRGALSSADWSTFNAKQDALTLTTSGSSGASTLVGATLNVPTYTLSGLGGVPTSRQLTINGTAFDLSADRSWSVGTVTSVGLSSATSGVTIGNTPVTGSGTITLAIATATSTQQGLLSSTDWSTFNNKQNALTLTTTGTSGAATLVGATLNIPQYQAAGTYVTSVTASSPLASSGGTTPNITIQQASGSQSGFLSSTDWTTFNNKQNALTNPITGTGTTNYLPKFTGSTTIGNSQIFDNGTNVGIGTASPNRLLTIKNSIDGLNGISFQNYASTAELGFIRYEQTNDFIDIFNSSAFAGGGIKFSTNSAERARFTSGGILLVGTTSDNGARLQVEHNGNSPLLISTSSTTLFTTYRSNSVVVGYIGNGDGIVSSGGATNFGIRAENDLIFTSGGNNRRMTITSGGNVGIGTASPSAPLHIVTPTGVNFQNAIRFEKAGGYGEVNLKNYYTSGSNYGFGIDVAGTTMMVVNNAGNVGIGTSSPTTYSLSGTHVENFGGSTYAFIHNNTTTVKSFLASNESALLTALFTFSAHPLTFGTSNTERMRITSGGNVLIGTTTDGGARLRVAGDILIPADGRVYGNSATVTGSRSYLELYNSSTGDINLVTGFSSSSIVFATQQGTERMRITSGGNVSTGNGYTFTSWSNTGNIDLNDVYLSLSSSGSYGGIVANNAYFNSGWKYKAANNATLYQTLGGEHRFLTAGVGSGAGAAISFTQAMTLTSGGNVLIGTTTDNSHKLRVNGTGYFDTGIKTGNPVGSTTNDWLLGRALVSGTSTPDRWIRVQIGNLYYDILAVYMGSV